MRGKKVYLLSNGKRKCFRCKYKFTPHRLSLYLTRNQWREIIRWFLLEQSSQNISLRTGFERRRVLRALTIIRTSLTKYVPGEYAWRYNHRNENDNFKVKRHQSTWIRSLVARMWLSPKNETQVSNLHLPHSYVILLFFTFTYAISPAFSVF